MWQSLSRLQQIKLGCMRSGRSCQTLPAWYLLGVSKKTGLPLRESYHQDHRTSWFLCRPPMYGNTEMAPWGASGPFGQEAMKPKPLLRENQRMPGAVACNICVYRETDIHIQIYTSIHIYICTRTHLYIHICIYVLHIYIYIHVYVCVYIYIHACMCVL